MNRKPPSSDKLTNFVKLIGSQYQYVLYPSIKQEYYWPFDSKGGEEMIAYFHIWHWAYLLCSPENRFKMDLFLKLIRPHTNRELQHCCSQKVFVFFFFFFLAEAWSHLFPQYRSPQIVTMCYLPWPYPLSSDFSCLLLSSFHLFNVSFNKTHWHVPTCCTTGFCSSQSRKEVSRLNKVKIRTVLKGISKAHVYMLNETGYNNFSFHQRQCPNMCCHDFL